MVLLTNDNQESISLAGKWHYKIDPIQLDLKKIPPSPPGRANRPIVLFNGMIAPLIPFGIRGAIWYQGDFPFIFVQLASWKQTQNKPEDSEWAELREAQSMALSLPITGMAVAIDIGDTNV